MKRTVVLVLLLAILGGVCPVFSALAAENVVYVCDGGTGDGFSDQSPLGTLTDAYNKLGDNGGTIVICGSFELTAHFYEPSHSKPVTVTQVYGGKDYRNGTENTVYIKAQGRRYFLAGPTTFENINFKGDTSATNNYILFIAQFNPIVMGEGITSTDFPNTTVAKSLCILGGCQGGAGIASSVSLDLDSKITVKSGRFMVVGFSRQQTAALTGCAHINIEGGEITTLYGGSINNSSGGDANINISGGKIVGDLNVSDTNPSRMKGDSTITVTGGDFSECTGILGNVDSFCSIDISAHPDADSIKEKISDFDEIITEAGVSQQISVNEAFLSGSFTDSNGTTIPYRYYLPKNYDPAKTYPLFLYMHGNGSRGSDNQIHLTTNGAALNTKVYNSGVECIMLAPQCPSAPNAWVLNGRHPGSADFVGTTEMSPHLSAAKELFDKFVEDYSVDTKRIYVTGSSNGGAATWELVYRFPNTFAAAVPLAGCGHPEAAEDVADGYLNTAIYTFHGDADATVPVEGTRGLVKAIKDAGGNITYVEIPGGDHNIWSDAANTDGIVDWIFAQTNENYSPDEREYVIEPDTFEPADSVPVKVEVNTVYLKAKSHVENPAVVKAGETAAPADVAFADFNKAYNALAATGGGRIVLIDRYPAVSVTGLASHPETIVITARDKEGDPLVFASGATFKAGGPVTFENLRMVLPGSNYFFGNFFHLTMGEGLTFENTEGTALTQADVETWTAGERQDRLPSVVGGTLDVTASLNTHVTIKSGLYRAVAGGSRSTSGTRINNGTFRMDIEGGYIGNVFGGNWTGGGSILGGQAHIRMTGGTVNALYTGGQTSASATLGDSIMYFSGGEITSSLRCSYTAGMTTIVYSGDISSNLGEVYNHTGASAETSTAEVAISTQALKTANGYVKITAQKRAGTVVNIVPAAEGAVYVSSSGKTAATGSKTDPVRYLHQAIAMLTEKGGTVVLADDYTFDAGELNSFSEFNEFPHNGKITIDGVDGKVLAGIVRDPVSYVSGSYTATVNCGLYAYNMSGDTTFANLTFASPASQYLNICARFNELNADNVAMQKNSGSVRLLGGAYIYADHFAYSASFNANFYAYGSGDPVINVNSGDYLAIIPYSRISDDDTEAAFTYPGSATVDISGSATVKDLYTSSYGSKNAHNGDVEVALHGNAAVTNALWSGGNGTGKGMIDGDLTIHHYENATVGRYGTAVNNCTGKRTFIIDTDYATFLKMKKSFAGASVDNGDGKVTVVKTGITAPAFGDFGFGVKYASENSYSIRYGSSILAEYFIGENADKYNIVELGVLVKAESNENALEYVHGKESYLGISDVEGVENYDAETKTAKSVIYVKDGGIDRYMWAGELDETVDFVAPVKEIGATEYGTRFVFCPYIVVTDKDGGNAAVVLGTETAGSVAEEVERILDGADPENYTADQQIAAKIYAEIAIAE